MTIRAVLFDIDGTLVDSNYLHIEAWSKAFETANVPVEAWRVHRAIGMDGQKLMGALLADTDQKTREWAQELHSTYYGELAGRLRTFAGTRELLQDIKDRGLAVVLATSAPPPELTNLRKVLKAEDVIDVVTSADDVETAKPAPDIVQISLERAEVKPDEAVMVGDSVWDGRAAERAGVAFIGVRSGGISSAELLDAGAAAVYDDVADLRNHLGEGPLGAKS